MFLRAFMPWLHFDWTFALSSLGRMQRKCLTVLHGMTQSVIRSRKEKVLKNSEMEQQGTDPSDIGTTGRAVWGSSRNEKCLRYKKSVLTHHLPPKKLSFSQSRIYPPFM